MKQIKIILGKDGTVSAEAEGFEGNSCDDATAFLDKLFGNPSDKELKAEYYQANSELVGPLPSGFCG